MWRVAVLLPPQTAVTGLQYLEVRPGSALELPLGAELIADVSLL